MATFLVHKPIFLENFTKKSSQKFPKPKQKWPGTQKVARDFVKNHFTNISEICYKSVFSAYYLPPNPAAFLIFQHNPFLYMKATKFTNPKYNIKYFMKSYGFFIGFLNRFIRSRICISRIIFFSNYYSPPTHLQLLYG